MEGTKTHEGMRAELLAKAAADDGFRAHLMEDPKATIEQALGVDMPDVLDVQVHEESALKVHLVLPPKADLTEAELEQVAAGHDSMYRHRHEDDGSVTVLTGSSG